MISPRENMVHPYRGMRHVRPLSYHGSPSQYSVGTKTCCSMFMLSQLIRCYSGPSHTTRPRVPPGLSYVLFHPPLVENGWHGYSACWCSAVIMCYHVKLIAITYCYTEVRGHSIIHRQPEWLQSFFGLPLFSSL